MSLKDALPLAGLPPAAPAVANVIPKAQTEIAIPAAHPKGKLYRWTRLHYSETDRSPTLRSRTMTSSSGLWTTLDSPVGLLTLVAGQTGLRAVLWPNSPQLATLSPEHRKDSPLLQQAGTELSGYFEGAITTFAVPLEWQGTPFQIAVWKTLCAIPYGETVSYAEVARQIGKPSAIRAVARAIGRNPIGIIIPCHRVVGSDGSLTGFAGGLDTKAALLSLEARFRYATNTFTIRA